MPVRIPAPADTEHRPADNRLRRRRVSVPGTTLAVEVRGHGEPLLLIHGGGEDATMLAEQAESLASAGFRVVTYDRRGTGGSGREAWPGNGAEQHADDAAALLVPLDSTRRRWWASAPVVSWPSPSPPGARTG